ncbi:hypothetical protein HOLleu_31252 [Holothuria leucospilota]|uniref:Uncharacterized protein n=1 Tax=Holothuria leucospilota TaxID=206669 RepID=A0A9Q0YPZ9_HOLLE|nr:hypothetical protein HOLleu_31252 [Holothuria leucospilota]
MWQFKAIVFFLAVSHLIESRSPPYPGYEPEISTYVGVPGEIIDGISVKDIIETLGRAWNVNSLKMGTTLACKKFGNVTTGLVQQQSQPNILEIACDGARNSKIEQACHDIWDVEIGEDVSFSLFPGLTCRENDYGGDFLDFYDICSEDGQGIAKINNILFALIDWLGPPLLNIIYKLDFQSVCSIGRYILSMNPSKFTEQMLGVAKYPVADILEYLRSLDICHQSDNVRIDLLKNLLVELSIMTYDEFCDYISTKHTREGYLKKAEMILKNALLTYVEKQRCNNVLSIVASLDEEGSHVQYLGYNLSVTSERSDFCQQAISALSASSSYHPSPYRFPSDLKARDWEPFSTPGELLPGLTFINLLEIEGAARRGETILKGLSVYCTVFKGFVVEQFEDEVAYNISSLCELVERGDLEGLEGMCQALFITIYDRPVGLKTVYPLPIAIFWGRQLTGITDISKEEICAAVDKLFNEKSLEDLVTSFAEFFIAGCLPPAHSVCQNWEETVCYWEPYCPEPVSNRRAPFQQMPSSKYVEEANAEFNEILSRLVSLLLIATDVDDGEEFCDKIARGIDPMSGRAFSGVADGLTVSGEVKEFRSQVLGLLTDIGRCSKFVEISLELAQDAAAYDDSEGGYSNRFYQVTGFSSPKQFCKAISDAHGITN